MFTLTKRDRQRLVGVHSHLIRVIETAAAQEDIPRFTILEGLRSKARQVELVQAGASWTLKSRHLTGHAVDLAPLIQQGVGGGLVPSWHWPHYRPLAAIIKEIAAGLQVTLDWGGDLRKRPDGPHWQLNWKAYPS
jgi:peptidoglycan L-alanyl-D-glutamate endopeptidase CwlK